MSLVPSRVGSVTNLITNILRYRIPPKIFYSIVPQVSVVMTNDQALVGSIPEKCLRNYAMNHLTSSRPKVDVAIAGAACSRLQYPTPHEYLYIEAIRVTPNDYTIQ